jgi:hypothetical protein
VNVSPITFTATFTEAVTGVGVGDFAATGSVSGALALSNFQAVSPTVYTMEVTGAATGENVTLTLTAAGSGIADAAANALAANATATVTLDTTAPTAAITPNGTTVNTSPITFTVTFDEAVTGVGIADFAAAGSQSGLLTLSNFQTVSPSVYKVDVSGMTTSESVALTLTAAGSGISDSAGNALAAGATATVNFVDNTAPTAAITPNGTTVNTSPITFTVTFNEAVTGVNIADLAAAGSTTGALSLGNFQAVSATVYRVDASGMASGENVTLTLTAAGSGISDTAGNALAANAQGTVSFDTTAPAGYTIAADDSLLNAAEAAAASFTFTSAEVGTTYNYTVTSSGGGTPVTGSGTISLSGQQVTGINVSSLPDGLLTYSVVLADAAGNVGAATAATATLDKTAPVATTTAVVNGSRIEFTVNFNEDVTGFDVSDLTATGSVTGALVVKDVTANTPSSYRVRVEGMTTVSPGEQVTLRSPSVGSVSDLAGNAAAVDAVFAQFNWVV